MGNFTVSILSECEVKNKMYITFEEYDYYQQKQIAKLPICARCGKHILSEKMIRIEGEWHCEPCKDKYIQENSMYVDDYMEVNR